MRSVFGARRPVCVVLDEVDGSANSECHGAVAAVLELVKAGQAAAAPAGGEGAGDGADDKATASAVRARLPHGALCPPARRLTRWAPQRRKKQRGGVQGVNRPIICICNDLVRACARVRRRVNNPACPRACACLCCPLTCRCPPVRASIAASAAGGARFLFQAHAPTAPGGAPQGSGARALTPRAPPADRRRLQEICSLEGVHVSPAALGTLCEATDCDVRSSLNALQFLKTRTSNVRARTPPRCLQSRCAAPRAHGARAGRSPRMLSRCTALVSVTSPPPRSRFWRRCSPRGAPSSDKVRGRRRRHLPLRILSLPAHPLAACAPHAVRQTAPLACSAAWWLRRAVKMMRMLRLNHRQRRRAMAARRR